MMKRSPFRYFRTSPEIIRLTTALMVATRSDRAVEAVPGAASGEERAVARYIDGFYDPVRRLSSPGFQSAIAFERNARDVS